MSYEERLVLSGENSDILRDEHLVRYQLASRFVKDKLVLDIASGSGYGSMILAEAGAKQVVGMDVDKQAVAEAAKKYQTANLAYKEGSAEAIPQEDGSAEVIVSFETIEHLNDQEKYLSELRRVAKDDGLVLISTPNKDVFKNKNPFHVKELTGPEFSELVKRFFSFTLILEQSNGLATFLKRAGEKALKEVAVEDSGAPLYFLAICSKSELKGVADMEIGRVNVKALQRLKNNPILKFSDMIYPFFKKIIGR